ncbi:MAG: LuxR C-terminal-related transcriptional regulator [Pseudomonadota bacterium]
MGQNWENVIDKCYIAALDESVWHELVLDTAKLFGSSVAGIELNSAQNPVNRNTAAQTNFDLHCLQKYFEEFNSPKNNIGIRAVMRATPGQAFRISDFMSADLFATEPSTCAILHPQKINRGLMVSLCRPGCDFAWFNLYRNANDGDDDFTEQDVRRFTDIASHILRGARLSDRFQMPQRKVNDFMDDGVSSHYSDGLVSLSRTGHIVTLDKNAQQILDADLGLRVANGKLKSASRVASSDDEALKAFLSENLDQIEPFVLQPRHGLLLMLHRYAAPHSETFAHESAATVLRIAVVNLRASIDSSVVGLAFDLTPAEQSVIAALTVTPSASSAARKLGLSRETVKTHLRSIYGKTGMASLTQLMLLIGQLVNR